MNFEYDQNKSKSNQEKHGITLRNNKIRLISARRSRSEEEQIYLARIKNEKTTEED